MSSGDREVTNERIYHERETDFYVALAEYLENPHDIAKELALKNRLGLLNSSAKGYWSIKKTISWDEIGPKVEKLKNFNPLAWEEFLKGFEGSDLYDRFLAVSPFLV